MSSRRIMEREKGNQHRVPVFDKALTVSFDPEVRAGISRPQCGNAIFGHFRARHDPPAKEVVTARLLGDPAPDRVVPEIPDEGRWERKPSPIHLTFRDMHAAYGDAR